MPKFTQMLLEPYDIALEQLPLGASRLFAVATAASAHQIRRVVGLGGIGEPTSREDVVDAEFAPVLLLRLPAILAPVTIADSDPFRPFLPVCGQRQEWLITILWMANAGKWKPRMWCLPSASYRDPTGQTAAATPQRGSPLEWGSSDHMGRLR